jgi:hypothetical protein
MQPRTASSELSAAHPSVPLCYSERLGAIERDLGLVHLFFQ